MAIFVLNRMRVWVAGGRGEGTLPPKGISSTPRGEGSRYFLTSNQMDTNEKRFTIFLT